MAHKSRPRQGTIGWLGEKLQSEDTIGFDDALSRAIPRHWRSDYRKLGPNEGVRLHRLDVSQKEGIHHWHFNPPSEWGDPSFALLKWKVDAGTAQRDQWMSHSGEEVLFCTEGEVTYQFLWTPGGAPMKPLLEPVGAFHAIRIRPEIPHHNFSKNGAAGYMFVWHRSGSPNLTGIPEEEDQKLAKRRVRTPVRRVFETKELEKDPWRYALLYFDVKDRIQAARHRSGFTIQELADLCNLHPSLIWRVENGDTNVSTDNLLQIAQKLRVDLSCIGRPLHFLLPDKRVVPFQRESTCDQKEICDGIAHRPLLDRRDGYAHYLHPRLWTVKKDKVIKDELEADLGTDGMSTWIVLRGEGKFERDTTEAELLLEGSVLHLRNRTKGRLVALKDSNLLQVVYSCHCLCNDPAVTAGGSAG